MRWEGCCRSCAVRGSDLGVNDFSCQAQERFLDEEFVFRRAVWRLLAAQGCHKGDQLFLVGLLAGLGRDRHDLGSGIEAGGGFFQAQANGEGRLEGFEQDGAAFCAVDFEAASHRCWFHGGNVYEGEAAFVFEHAEGVVRALGSLGAISAEEGGCSLRSPHEPDDLIEHVTAEVEEDSPLVDGKRGARGIVDVCGHVSACAVDVAQQAAVGPFGDLAETTLVAEHVAHLDEQVTVLGFADDALPCWPVFAGRFVVPYVFAGVDESFGLGEAFGILAFGGDGDDGSVGKELFFVVEPVDLAEWASVVLDLGAAFGIGFVKANDFDIGRVEHGLELAGGVAVFCAVLGHSDG